MRTICALMMGLVALFATAPVVTAQVDLQQPDPDEPIAIAAREASQWKQGAYELWRLKGGVSFTQGKNVWRASEAIVWVDKPTDFDEPTKLIAYLEAGDGEPVWLDLYDKTPDPAATPIARQQSPEWFGRLRSVGGVEWKTPPPSGEPVEKPAIYARAQNRFSAEWDPLAGDAPAGKEADPRRDARDGDDPFPADPFRDDAVTPVQFLSDPFATVAPTPAPSGAGQPSFRSAQVFSRYGGGLRAELLNSSEGEPVGVLSGGVTIVVSGLEVPGMPAAVGSLDRVDLSADRAVVWTSGAGGLSGGLNQSGDTPFEVYLEGNIEVRQGDRTIYAQRMFYDARRKTGVILDAELITPVPELDYRGSVRLKAKVLQQLEDSRFVADDTMFTTSRIEVPTYSLRSDRMTFEDYEHRTVDPLTGQPAADPFTGAPISNRQQFATAQGNRVEFGGVPLLYWPTLETDLSQPRYYIDDFRIRNDSVFGFQVLTDWDVHQLLGSRRPPGTKWTVAADYLSERGVGLGTDYQYSVDRFFGASGPAFGNVNAWFIEDQGTDNLGFGRRDIVPETDFRGRGFWSHRQHVRGGVFDDWTVQGQVGWLSDRTFYEQYYEQEYDERADQPTGLRLRRIVDNQSLTIEANGQLNDFYTETQWLPRLDHWLMGQELVDEQLTWFAHSQAAYANSHVATTPTNPTLAGQFFLFPWEAPMEGERFVTRQELDLPIDLEEYGLPAKVVPYFLGEAAHWGDSLAGGDLQRVYFQTGVRASAPFWAVNPNVRDPLFNLDGLAHKVVFDAEASYADASRDLTEFALWDEIEDNTQEDIRRRQFFPTIPALQDPRFYMVRSGMQSWVGAPTTEVVDDLSVARVGMRHRLQTKRGAPGSQHVVDWITFDTNASLFPDTDQNFGEAVGLLDYDLAWHLGDRFTFLSDGFADLFTDGLQTWSTGVLLNRPARGNAYIGYRSVRGPFNSDIVSLRLNYRLNEKWVGSAATVVDFGEAGNIGQTFSLSRIGESLLFTLGMNVDESKNNVGFSFMVEPRFLPRTNLTRRTGIDIPPAGAYGLE